MTTVERSALAGGRFFVVFNHGSGEGDAEEAIRAIESVLSGAGRLGALFRVEDSSQLASVAEQAVRQALGEDGIVVAAGGDGTLNAVAAAAMHADVPLGIVPLGTFNYFARNQGIPLDTMEAASALLHAHIEPVQVGTLNQRVFLVNASLGLYPQLLKEREHSTQRLGRNRVVAWFSALVTLARAHRALRVQVDLGGRRQRLNTLSMVVVNNALQLEQLGVDLQQGLERGRLIAIVVKPVGTLALFGLLVRGLISRLGEAENLDCFTFSRMEVGPVSQRRIQVAVDGEVVWMRPPLRFEAEEGSLRLLVPMDSEQQSRH